MGINNILYRWKYSLALNIIFLTYLVWLSYQTFDGIFGGIVELGIFFVVPILFYTIHSFYFVDVKTKIIIGVVDLFPLFLSQIIESMRDSDISILLLGTIFVYILPVIAITFLSWGLTYLWRRYKK